MKPTILITAATGTTGFPTAQRLLRAGYPVRIFVRSRNARALDLEQQGAEVALGEFGNDEQLRAALTGVSRVYYCYPFKPGLVADVALFIRAAQEAGIDAVVFMGQWLAEFEDQRAVQTRATRKAYQLLEASGLNVVYFTPGYFAENTVGVLLEFAVQLGLLMSPFGAGRNPVPSDDDLADCLAALLQNPTPYVGQRLRPTGPELVSAREMAAVIARVTGRRVRTVPVPEWMFLKAAFRIGREFNYDAFTIGQARYYNHEFRADRFAVGGPTDVVQRLTGHPPADFETIVRRYLAQAPYGTPSWGGWWRALRKFMLIPLQPVPSRRALDALNQ